MLTNYKHCIQCTLLTDASKWRIAVIRDLGRSFRAYPSLISVAQSFSQIRFTNKKFKNSNNLIKPIFQLKKFNLLSQKNKPNRIGWMTRLGRTGSRLCRLGPLKTFFTCSITPLPKWSKWLRSSFWFLNSLGQTDDPLRVDKWPAIL